MKIRKSVILYISILFIAITACTQKRTPLELVLLLAGENRPELEKVLDRYKAEPADSLKYRAACFLIENMPWHYSYEDQAFIDQYYDSVDCINKTLNSNNYDQISNLYADLSREFIPELKSISDIKVIKSDFLIKNIDQSFEAWQEGNWAQHVNFHDFCEYILPYKMTDHQSLDDWREYLLNKGCENLDVLQYCGQTENSAYWACYNVNRELNRQLKYKIHMAAGMIPIKRVRSALLLPMGSCEAYSLIATSVMRANGIPVVVDYTPQWANRSSGHSWCVLLANSGKNISFDGVSPAGINEYIDDPMAKVFRKTFAVNKELLKIHQSEEYIPQSFIDPRIKDVTDVYKQTDDFDVKLNDANHKYAYLSVFNNTNWIPVCWGKVTQNQATFQKIGRDIVYLPVFWGKTGMVPAAEPFILTSRGEIKPLRPDTTKKQTLVLYRKYPASKRTTEPASRIIGGKIQAANTPGFSDSITVHTIAAYGTQSGEIELQALQKPYRYWRYCSPENAYCNIAELLFFKGNENITTGKIIGKRGSWGDGKNNDLEAVFDNDPLTFFDSLSPSDGWVGIDFGKPVSIDRIIYVPRSDGNCVTYGDEYELSYWNNGGWASLGKKKAEHISITFDSCPANALFLLHDCSRGTEDRIFTYENDKQVWW